MKNASIGCILAILLAGIINTVSIATTAEPVRPADLGTIHGRVVDVNGNGVKSASVSVESRIAAATTSADGTFKIGGIEPGSIYLNVKSPSELYLDGQTKRAIQVNERAVVKDVVITLSGRPGNSAKYTGKSVCANCHDSELSMHFDGTAKASAHSRFVTEGTSHLAYKHLWPNPGEKFLPRDPNGKLLLVLDPLDGKGLVHVVLCTKGDEPNRKYYFKFYPEQPAGKFLTEAELDASDNPPNSIWIPVAATIGGEGNWGEGYTDPHHAIPDKSQNFGEGKQRYMARLEDVPYLVKWMEENKVSRANQKQDYVPFMPVFMVQDGTPVGSPLLSENQIGFPNFWQKSPKKWVSPDNTLSRNCAGCHATGVVLETRDIGEYKSVVTFWDYKDLNISCERCHGPGSEHAANSEKSKIISPQHLTAKASNQMCGQCHGSHDGKSQNPMGVFKPPFDAKNQKSLGNGFFVPGVYDLETFYYKFNTARVDREGEWKGGSFMTWPDQTHGSSHSMEYSELSRSKHWENETEKLTCASCHDTHTLASGPKSLQRDEYNFVTTTYDNNSLCLSCHAYNGEFADITLKDVAAIQVANGGVVKQNGSELTFDPTEIALSKNGIARSIAKHMQVKAGMGGALYTPENPNMPVGNCTSCHMPKTGKLQDVMVDAQYHLDYDKNGNSSVAEGNVPSHVFDVVWPGQSAILLNPDPSKGKDWNIMPNSCGKCHAFARLSGDGYKPAANTTPGKKPVMQEITPEKKDKPAEKGLSQSTGEMLRIMAQARVSLNMNSGDWATGSEGIELVSNGSRLGLTGEAETHLSQVKLIYKAMIHIENTYNSGTPLFYREAFAGLKGPWGKVRFGRLTVGYKVVGIKIDPWTDNVSQARAFGRQGMSELHLSYLNNVMSYQTPKLPLGLNGDVWYSTLFDNSTRPLHNTGTLDDYLGGNMLGLSIYHENGPIYIGTAFVSIDADSIISGKLENGTGVEIVVRYTYGPISFGGFYEDTKKLGLGNNLYVNSIYRYGRTNFILGYGQNRDGEFYDNKEWNNLSFGLKHNINKTSEMFAAWNQRSNVTDEKVYSTISMGMNVKFGY